MRHPFSGIILVVAVLLCSVCGSPGWTQEEPRLLTREEAIADLDRLYRGLRAADIGLFASTLESAFDAEYERIRASLSAALSPAEFHRLVQPFTALARHSHTRIEGLNPGWSAYVGEGGRLFPLYFRVVDGDVVVTGTPADSGIELGDLILSINGHGNDVWLPQMTRFISTETPEFAHAVLAMGEPYFAWLAYGGREQFDLEIQRGEQIIPVTVEALPVASFGDLVQNETGFSLDGREARMLTAGIAYLRPGPFSNTEAESPADSYAPAALAAYQDFVDSAFRTFIANGAEHLVLDLRDNPGGSNSFSDPVVAWFADEPFRFASEFRLLVSEEAVASNAARLEALQPGEETFSTELAALYETAEIGEMVLYDLPYVTPRSDERFSGEVHVLVNERSFSNAVTTAALIQDYSFGTIYGAQTLDMATTYGAMEHFTLPHSGLLVGFSEAHIIRPNGEERAHPVTPDVILPAPAIRGSQDVRLEQLIDQISGN